MNTGLSNRQRAVGAAILLAFAASPLLSLRLEPNAYEGGRSRSIEDRMIRNSSAVARILGDLRTNMSDMIFIKTERYLHSGVAYDPHMDRELLSIAGETAEYDHHQEEVFEDHAGHDHEGHDDHSGTPTIILSPDRDFRGWIGRMHRHIHPWRDPSEPHLHTDGTELLPWYRVMTLADPHNVRAYSIGAYWLRSHSLEEAAAFAQEGLRHNPTAFQLEYVLGNIASQRGLEISGSIYLTDIEEALVHFREAMVHFQRAADMGLKKRPVDYIAGGKDLPQWTHYTEEDLLATVRLGVLFERDYGDVEKARRLAREYLSRLGSDAVLERFLANTE